MHNVRSPNQWWSSIALLHRSRNRGTNGTYLLHSRVHNSILGQKFYCAMVFPSQMLTRPKKSIFYWNFLSIEDFMFDWRRHEKFQSSIGHFHTLKLVHNFTKQFSPSDLLVLFKAWLAMCNSKLRIAMCGSKLRCAGANPFCWNLRCACVRCIFRLSMCDHNFAHFSAIM